MFFSCPLYQRISPWTHQVVNVFVGFSPGKEKIDKVFQVPFLFCFLPWLLLRIFFLMGVTLLLQSYFPAGKPAVVVARVPPSRMEQSRWRLLPFFLFQGFRHFFIYRRDLRMVICAVYLRFGVINRWWFPQIKSVTLFVWGMLAIFGIQGNELFKTIHMKLYGDVQ